MSSQALRCPILAQQNDALACAGCSFSKMSSRLHGVIIFTITRKKPHFGEPPVSLDDALSALDAALACAGCTLLPKMLVSPQRRAHSTYPHFEFTLQYQIEPFSALSSPIVYFLRHRRICFLILSSPIFCFVANLNIRVGGVELHPPPRGALTTTTTTNTIQMNNTSEVPRNRAVQNVIPYSTFGPSASIRATVSRK